MKRQVCTALCLVGLCGMVSLTGCGKKEDANATQATIETTNAFAVNDDINLIANQGDTNNKALEEAVSYVENTEADGNFNNTVSESIAWEVQESENAYLDESIAAEESEEYEEYINSDEKLEVTLVYDRTENGVMVFKNESGDDSSFEDTIEYRIVIADVTEGIDEIQQGDLATIICNMAVDYETNTFLKVWEVKNLTTELNSLEDEDDNNSEIPDGEIQNEVDMGSSEELPE